MTITIPSPNSVPQSLIEETIFQITNGLGVLYRKLEIKENGVSVRVRVVFKSLYREHYNATIKRSACGQYHVVVPGGLIAVIALTAYTATNILSSILKYRNTTISPKPFGDRKSRFSHLFTLMLIDLVLSHEFGHAFQGHLGLSSNGISDSQRMALEAEADKYAITLSLGKFDNLLQFTKDFRYKVQADAFHDYGAVLALFFCVCSSYFTINSNSSKYPNYIDRVNIMAAFADDAISSKYTNSVANVLRAALMLGVRRTFVKLKVFSCETEGLLDTLRTCETMFKIKELLDGLIEMKKNFVFNVSIENGSNPSISFEV